MNFTRIRSTVTCIALITQAAISWANCTDVIALSRVTSRTVASESDFAVMAKAFCTQYSSNKASSAGMTIGLEYAGVGGNFGSNEAKADAIASKTCDSLNSLNVSESAFRNYVETIAPGAYPSYDKCVQAKNNNIEFSADPSSALETTMVIGVTNSSRDNARIAQTFEFQPSAGLTCIWKDSAMPNGKVTLLNNQTTSMRCTRNDSSKRGSVVVYTTTRGDIPVTFVWQEYRAGQKVDDLRSLQNRTLAAETELALTKAKLNPLLTADSGLVYKCPSGTAGVSHNAAWHYVGCNGQYSTESTCSNYWHTYAPPMQTQTRQCTPAGSLKLFK